MRKPVRELYRTYDNILGKLVNMINDPSPWLLPGKEKARTAAPPRRD